jgi:hypothetical protein
MHSLSLQGSRTKIHPGKKKGIVQMKVNAELYNKMPSDLQALFEQCPNLSRDEVVGLFPQQQSGGFSQGMVQHSRTFNVAKGVEAERVRDARAPDAGSAARFFYCAKASKADRGEGNTHPTVKPTDLMRYLCRLVTPPGGTVLDPFAGSGSTGKAAALEGFRFIGIEREAEYLAIAEARISHASGLSQPPQRPTRQPAPACPGQLALF